MGAWNGYSHWLLEFSFLWYCGLLAHRCQVFFSFLLVSTSIYPSIHPGMPGVRKSSLIFKPGPDRWEGSSHGQIWLKTTSRRRNGMCKSLTQKWAWHVQRMKEDQIDWSTVAMKRLVYDEWRSGWMKDMGGQQTSQWLTSYLILWLCIHTIFEKKKTQTLTIKKVSIQYLNSIYSHLWKK